MAEVDSQESNNAPMLPGVPDVDDVDRSDEKHDSEFFSKDRMRATANNGQWDWCILLKDFDVTDSKEPDEDEANFRLVYTHLVHQFGEDHVEAINRGNIDQEHSFIKVSAELDDLESIAEKKNLELKGREDHWHGNVYFPFSKSRKAQGFFEHPRGSVNESGRCPFEDDPETPCTCNLFLPYQTSFLTYQLISEALDAALSEMEGRLSRSNRGLREFRRKGIIADIFPMHKTPNPQFYDDSDKILKRYLTGKVNVFKTGFSWTHHADNFLSYMRDYFGEKIALYFGFLQFYNTWLIILTIGGVIPGVLQYFYEADNETVPVYCFFLIIWAVFFMKFWKRRNSDLAYEWNMMNFEDTERELDSFLIEMERAAPGQEPVYGFYEASGRWVDLDDWADHVADKRGDDIKLFIPRSYRDATGKLPDCCFRRLYSSGSAERDAWKQRELNAIVWRIVKEAISTSVVMTFVGLVVVVSVSLLLLRLVLISAFTLGGGLLAGAVNSVSITLLDFIYKKMAVKMTEWENHRTATQFEDKLVSKFFAFQFINSYFVLFYIAFFKAGLINDGTLGGYRDICKTSSGEVASTCMSELSQQVTALLLTRVFVENINEVAYPWVLEKFNVYWKKRNTLKQIREENPKMSDDEVEAELARRNQGMQVGPGERQAQKLKYQLHPNVSGVFDDYNELAIGYGYVVMFAAAFPLSSLIMLFSNVLEISIDGWKLFKTCQRPMYAGARDIGQFYSNFEFMTVMGVIVNTGIIVFTSKQVDNLFDQPSDAKKIAIAVAVEHIVLVLMYVITTNFSDQRPSLREELARAEECRKIEEEYQLWLAHAEDEAKKPALMHSKSTSVRVKYARNNSKSALSPVSAVEIH